MLWCDVYSDIDGNGKILIKMLIEKICFEFIFRTNLVVTQILSSRLFDSFSTTVLNILHLPCWVLLKGTLSRSMAIVYEWIQKLWATRLKFLSPKLALLIQFCMIILNAINIISHLLLGMKEAHMANHDVLPSFGSEDHLLFRWHHNHGSLSSCAHSASWVGVTTVQTPGIHGQGWFSIQPTVCVSGTVLRYHVMRRPLS